ncbi:MAG TPA: pentapeptide repeat-containing protein [Bacteroidales bacterium]|nr:pentapeptide repeat-containing protein [Bacteroidales bacterium]
MSKINDTITKAIEEHEKWLSSWGDNGKRIKIQNITLQGSNIFCNRDLRYASFMNVAFIECDFTNANLVGAKMQGNFSRSIFKNADLSYINAFGANFEGACLNNTSLHKAILNKTNLCGVDMRGSTICKALLSEADLRNAEFDVYVLFEIMKLYRSVIAAEFDGNIEARHDMPILDDYVYMLIRGFTFGS